MTTQTVILSGDALAGIDGTIQGFASLPEQVKLGRVRGRHPRSVPHLGDYWSPADAVAPPASTNRRAKASASLAQMDLNDELGCCHSADTEVLTEDGWTRWPDYNGDSLLGTMNQATGMLEFQAPLACQRLRHDGPMAFGTHKGQDFSVTPNHRFFMRPYVIPYPYVPGQAGYGPCEFRTIDKAPAHFLIPGTTSGFAGVQLDRLTIGDRQWAGDDFLRLLALVLSDGYVSDGEANRMRVSFCCFREDRQDWVRAFAQRLGIREEKSRPGVWMLYDHAMADWMRANLYVGDVRRSPFKRVPDLVKAACQAQIAEFLNWFGDQSITDGARQFYTSSHRMAGDLQELLLHVGKRTNVGERPARPGREMSDGRWIETKHPCFNLHEWADGSVSMLSNKNRKASYEYDHYKGDVFCATVPNSTLITRRNGSVLVSGNCVIAGKHHATGLWSANDSDSDGEVLATEEEIQDAYDRLKAGPGDSGCVITDVLDAMRTDGIVFGGVPRKIDGYAAVDWTNKLLTQVVLDLFGACSIGINLPEAWTSAAVWDVTNTQIVGGHDVTPLDYDERGVYVASWGRVYLITWRAWQSTRWIEEFYALLAPLWYGNDRLAPSGVDAAALKADLAMLGKHRVPPLPDPDVPPVPPPLPPTPPVKALAVYLSDPGKTMQLAAHGTPDASGTYHLVGTADVPGTFGRHHTVNVSGTAQPAPISAGSPLAAAAGGINWLTVLPDLMRLVDDVRANAPVNTIVADAVKLAKDFGGGT